MYTLNQMRRTKYYLDFLQHNNSQHNLNLMKKYSEKQIFSPSHVFQGH